MASPSNATLPRGFLLQGFAEFPHLRPALFLLLLALHLATLSGNLLILLAVASATTRPPMHLFLCQLSAIELGYTLVVVPRTLADLASPPPRGVWTPPGGVWTPPRGVWTPHRGVDSSPRYASEVRCPCAWRGGACHCSRVMVGESGLQTR